MLKDFLWRTFERTGNIDPYMLFKEITQKGNVKEGRTPAEEEAATTRTNL